ncbi:MAG TPA: type II CAAX endopeptidase family protein [Bryobacteraceae bacterium]|nr:type II CAAX endopeptidase family protein [Bryobacteraceae bacterium]
MAGTAVTRPTTWARRTLPISGFTFLAYAFSLLGFLVLMLPSTRPPDRLSPYVRRLGVVYGPALAALVMASSLRGRRGVHQLLRSMLPNRRWVVAPAIIAAGLIATAAAARICGASPGQILGTIHAWPLFFAHVALQFFFVGCGEEMGWRGWLLPRLRERHTAGAAATIVGAIWGVWHLPILLTGIRTAAVFLFGVFGLSYLFTALWEYSGGSVFLIAVAHAAVNAPLSWFNEPGVLASLPSEALFETAMGIYGVLGLGFVIARCRWFFSVEQAQA